MTQVLVSAGTGLELLGLFLVAPRISSWVATRKRIETYRLELAFYSLVAAEKMVSRGPFAYRSKSTRSEPMAAAWVAEEFGKASEQRKRVVFLLLPRLGLLLALVVPLTVSLAIQLPLWIGLAASYGLYTLASLKWDIEAAREVVEKRHPGFIIAVIGFLLGAPIAPALLLPFLLYWVVVVAASLILANLCSYLSVPDATRKVLAAAGFLAGAIGVGLQLWASLA